MTATAVSRPGHRVVRQGAPGDHGAVRQILAEPLSTLYPDGPAWLDRRLQSIDKAGRLTVMCDRAAVVAVAVETWKPHRRVKLSTFYVGPGSRRIGAGRTLAQQLALRWRAEQVLEAYVTVASGNAAALEAVLGPLGFLATAVERDRYGPGRDETVMTWLPGDPRR